jgi:ATP/maltotriose-dependent transcriptional regulator MalT
VPLTIERRRVTRRIASALEFPVAVVRGTAGCGKSLALRDALSGARACVLFEVTHEHRTFARFVRGFTEVLREHAPGARISFGSAYERAMQSRRPGHDLAAWLHEHLKHLTLTIAIDNLHNAHGDPLTEAFLAHLIDLSAPNLRWAIACRNADGFPLPRWMAFGLMDLPIESSDLAFDALEIAQLARRIGEPLDDAACNGVAARTGGWATGVAYLLHAGPDAIAGDESVGAFASVIERLLSEYDSWELRTLISASVLPELAENLLSPETSAAVARLEARAPYLFSDLGGKRFHDLLAEALRERLRLADPREIAATIAAVAQTLRHRHRIVEALGLYSANDLPAPCAGLLEVHGLALLENGNADIVEEALLCVERSRHVQPPMLLAMRAIAESRLGRFDVAESWFNQALRHTGEDDAAMVEIKYLYACDLVRRYRPDALDLLRGHAGNTAISDELRAGVLSLLAQTWTLAGDSDRAQECIEKALRVLESSGADDALRARVYTRAAYVSLYRNDSAEARRYLTVAAEMAIRSASFGVATAAYSGLYVLALDAEEPLIARDHLEHLFESGMKSGNLQFQFYYLATSYEIAAERYDLAELARIDAALASFEPEYDDANSEEALLPGQALRATWTGEFERACRLLGPTAAHQASFDRVALRWAEIACYAAAAMRRQDALDAVERATAALAQADAPSRCARARIFLALATALLGRSADASQFLSELGDAALPKRLRAAVDVVNAVADRLEGARNHDQLDDALSETYRHEFGGFARMVEALPLRAVVASLAAANAAVASTA